MWTRLQCEPQLPDGSYDPLALAVHGDVIGPAVGQGLGPIGQPFMVLSLEIGIRFVATPVTPWVLQEIEAWHVGDGYATGPARLWDEDGNLCAIATQTANLRVFRPSSSNGVSSGPRPPLRPVPPANLQAGRTTSRILRSFGSAS